MSTPCPIFNFNSPSVGSSRSASSAAAAAVALPVAGSSDRPLDAGVKHPRLQVARLFAGRHIARIEVDRVAAVAREGSCERRRIGPGPPQRLARGNFRQRGTPARPR